jgi:hypothetical protein
MTLTPGTRGLTMILMARNPRVSVHVPPDFRVIAKVEKRSIARQAELVLQQFVQHWRSALPSSQPDQALRPMSDTKRDR